MHPNVYTLTTTIAADQLSFNLSDDTRMCIFMQYIWSNVFYVYRPHLQ